MDIPSVVIEEFDHFPGEDRRQLGGAVPQVYIELLVIVLSEVADADEGAELQLPEKLVDQLFVLGLGLLLLHLLLLLGSGGGLEGVLLRVGGVAVTLLTALPICLPESALLLQPLVRVHNHGTLLVDYVLQAVSAGQSEEHRADKYILGSRGHAGLLLEEELRGGGEGQTGAVRHCPLLVDPLHYEEPLLDYV